jgi:hypothetical protein
MGVAPRRDAALEHLELIRSSDEEKQSQLKRLRDFQKRHATESPAMLKRLQDTVIRTGGRCEERDSCPRGNGDRAVSWFCACGVALSVNLGAFPSPAMATCSFPAANCYKA